MKILLIAPQPFMAKRGTPFRVLQQLKALSELGNEVDILTYHLGEPFSLNGVIHHRIPRVPFIKNVGKGASAAKVILDVLVFFKAAAMLSKKRYDAIQAVEEAGIFSVPLKWIFRLPLLYNLDSSIPDQLRDSGSSLWSSWPIVRGAEFFERWTVKHSDVSLPVCDAIKGKMRSSLPARGMVTLEDIPNVEPFNDDMAGKLEELKEELGITDHKTVVYTGTFETYQGVDLLLEAIPAVVNACSDVKFVLVGGEGRQVEEKRRVVDEKGVGANVLILGKRPAEEMSLFMEMAEILVSPRIHMTNTPMKIYTYLQSGRPVVATSLLTHTQVLTDKTAMLVEPNPKAFAEGIVTLLRDEALRESLGSAGRQLVEENYSYKNFVKKVEAAYARIKI